MKLTHKDYLTILEHYEITIPMNKKNNVDRKQVKIEAEKILATKLCRCIKKVNPNDENESISLCTNSIFTKRNLSYGTFKCSPAFMLHKTKRNREALSKTRKKIKF